MLWIVLLQYVKTMWKPWLMTRLRGISLNGICSTAMRLLITTTCELRKKPLKMTADKHNERDLWIAYIKSTQSMWSGWLASFIMLLWHENDILLSFLSFFFFFFHFHWVNIRDSLPGKINMTYVATELSVILALHSLHGWGKQDVFSSKQKGYQLINSRF